MEILLFLGLILFMMGSQTPRSTTPDNPSYQAPVFTGPGTYGAEQTEQFVDDDGEIKYRRKTTEFHADTEGEYWSKRFEGIKEAEWEIVLTP